MNFSIETVIGRDPATAQPLNSPLDIPKQFLDGVTDYAGSYHLLAMGDHYVDYMVSPRRPAFRLRGNPGFPPSFACAPLLIKLADQGVTGNLGESIAAIVARDRLSLKPANIVHIVRTSRNRAPDFVMELGLANPIVGAVFQTGANVSGVVNAAPQWWPAEAKARGGNGGNGGFYDALPQLFVYWKECLRTGYGVASIGFGVIFSILYARRIVRVHFIAPKNVAFLTRYLHGAIARFSRDPEFAKHLISRKNNARRPFVERIGRRCLHGC